MFKLYKINDYSHKVYNSFEHVNFLVNFAS